MSNEITDTVTISRDEYDELLSDQAFLNCLRNAGVDNWDGFDFAVEEFQDTYEAPI